MTALLFGIGIAAVFLSGCLAATIMIDLAAHLVDRTTYWRAFWLVVNTRILASPGDYGRKEDVVRGFFLWLASTRLGGFHEWWPLFIMVHDHGITMGWRRVVRMDWRAKQP